MKNGRGAVYVIAIVLSFLYLIGLIGLIVLLAMHTINWFSFILSILAGGVELILVWALNNALERVAVLENLLVEKKVVKENEIIIPLDDDVPVESDENITYCKHCGFQLFPEDKVCPNCNNEVDKNEKTS